MLKTIPFYNFLLPFITKAVTPPCILGTKTGLIKIIDTYDKTKQAFIIGKKKLVITPSEFEVIMGITSGTRDIDMKDCQVGPTSLLKRKFNNLNLVKPHHLKIEVLNAVASSEIIDIHDNVRIIALHVMASILFVASNEVARVWMFRIYENLEELYDYNWAQAVLNYLMGYVNSSDAQDVKGCTIFLQVMTNISYKSIR